MISIASSVSRSRGVLIGLVQPCCMLHAISHVYILHRYHVYSMLNADIIIVYLSLPLFYTCHCSLCALGSRCPIRDPLPISSSLCFSLFSHDGGSGVSVRFFCLTFFFFCGARRSTRVDTRGARAYRCSAHSYPLPLLLCCARPLRGSRVFAECRVPPTANNYI